MSAGQRGGHEPVAGARQWRHCPRDQSAGFVIRMRVLLTLVLLLLTPLAARAALDNPADYAWQMAPGGRLPLQTALRDETGKPVQLGEAFGGRPVILDLGYFHCPSLCGVVRSDLFNALQTSGLVGGRDYEMLSLSIDPAETPGDAAQAKAADLAQARFASGAGWHYWTGTAAAIGAVTSVVGFHDRWDDQFKQFLHPAGLVVLTRTGTVSGYLLGVGYTGGDLRAAVVRAGEGGIAKAALPVLLLCFHFDSTTGRYTLEVVKVLRLMGVLTIATIGGLLLVLHRQRRRLVP
jgi:protein SCO1/2